MSLGGSRTIYTGRATNWPALWLTTALMVPVLVMAGGPDAPRASIGFLAPVAVMVATALVNLLTASSVRAIAGPDGVTVHFGVFGWPRFRYPIARISAAEAITIPPSIWAWGLHWSPRRGLMLTLRGGPALRLTLTGGRRVTVSTPRPEAAVTAIESARSS